MERNDRVNQLIVWFVQALDSFLRLSRMPRPFETETPILSPSNTVILNTTTSSREAEENLLVTIVRKDLDTFLSLIRKKRLVICDKRDWKVVAKMTLLEQGAPPSTETGNPSASADSNNDGLPGHIADLSGRGASSPSESLHDDDIPSRQEAEIHLKEDADVPSGKADFPSGDAVTQSGKADFPSGDAVTPSGSADSPSGDANSSPKQDADIPAGEADADLPSDNDDNITSVKGTDLQSKDAHNSLRDDKSPTLQDAHISSEMQDANIPLEKGANIPGDADFPSDINKASRQDANIPSEHIANVPPEQNASMFSGKDANIPSGGDDILQRQDADISSEEDV
ncbi:paternally-expressed gene 3 protein-like isoform X2 [Penaeus japonicus]|uniref:paternally-expressed gene 3 protein-like isoform X2 n=1 Tax=Penaeus japonicus TaxID=27405 RepID=UPI001C70D272|nr:paternally-expressed gene 3 protein-like isoform X2 [Penaeus japonicus]